MSKNIEQVAFDIPWDSIINLVGVVITVILSAYISNVVSKRSIESEIKKVEYQYKLESKKDNANFINKLKLEKLAELYELLGQYGRYNTKITLQINRVLRIARLDKISEDQKLRFVEERRIIEREFEEKNVMRQISINVSYFPKMIDLWATLSATQSRVVSMYIDQILGLKEFNNNNYVSYKIPDDYTLDQFENDLEVVSKMIMDFIQIIEKEIGGIMNELEK
ncbi:hypothetical protein [Enterococcus sp. N249-2]